MHSLAGGYHLSQQPFPKECSVRSSQSDESDVWPQADTFLSLFNLSSASAGAFEMLYSRVR